VCALVVSFLAMAGVAVWADEPAATVLADFEDASVALQITAVRNVLASDCRATRTVIPARGQGSLAVEIGATSKGTSVACDLTFREPTRFAQADRVATFCWLNEGENGIAFRIRDAHGQVFETPAQAVQLTQRWVRVAADLTPARLKNVRGEAALVYPIEIQGYRITTERLGKQTVFLDDLQVEHQVRPQDLIHGAFEFNEPTRIYEPGGPISAAVSLENRSRDKQLSISVDLTWTRSDGSVLQTQHAEVSLPASGSDFRSHRKLDFSQRIREPGLYRLVAQARAPGWSSPYTVSTTIAVTPSNRRVSRGRSTFFGVRTNLLREPELDQTLEIDVARDIGVNLLAVDTPWRSIEPKAGTYEFVTLDPVIAAVTKDMTAMLVLTDPPDWLPADSAARVDRLVELISALAGHFGERLPRFQLDAAVLNSPSVAAQLDAARVVRQRVAERKPKVEVLPPPIRVGDETSDLDVGAYAREHPDFPLGFQTSGTLKLSLRQLEAFRARGGFTWQASYWWAHDAEPHVGAGHASDAADVLRYHAAAASAGVGGVLWFDLRDDDNDPANRAALRGLVRRDFSPRTSLLGYASTAGTLTGYRCAGPVVGTPEEFDSALFIGTNRQIAVLLPRPNRVLPAVLAAVVSKRGELSVQDFERRDRPLLTSSAPPLIPTVPRPLFVTATFKQPQSDPQLTLTRPWLRVPATVFCGSEGGFAVELDAPRALLRSYLQVKLPKDAPFDSPTSAALRGQAGDTVRQEVRLAPKTGHTPAPATLTLRLSLEGDPLELALDVRPLVPVRPLAQGEEVTSTTYRIGELTAAPPARASAKAALHCAYRPDALVVALLVQDDRLVPTRVDPTGQGAGDQVLLGVACEGNPALAQLSISAADEPPAPPTPAEGRTERVTWRCDGKGKDGVRTYVITIPAAALGAGELAAKEHVLMSARYVDDDADGLPAVSLGWGGGLDGSDSTLEFQWLVLGGRSAP
jgi:hypothetical protein